MYRRGRPVEELLAAVNRARGLPEEVYRLEALEWWWQYG